MAERPDPRTRVEEQTWQVYDGRPEDQSDGLEPRPLASTPRWPWPAAAGAALVTAGLLGTILPPTGPAGTPGSGAVAAAGWQRAEGFERAGAVLVGGVMEADGIVLTPHGLVATSLTRIRGEGRPGEYGYSIDGSPATVVATDEAVDLALVQAPGFEPPGVARPGPPVQVGETVTLLDVQGADLPTLGIAVTVTGTGEVCGRAGSPSRPIGFRFSLDVATAEPGAALVRSDGSVVGLYYGGDEASRHCAIPIDDVLEAARRAGALK